MYVRAIAAVLSRYDPDLIREVTDVHTGISTSEKFRAFLPQSGELKHYCEEAAVRRARMRQYAEMPPPDFSRPRIATTTPPSPGRRASLLIRKGRPRYEEMCERARAPGVDPAEFQWHADGIKVSLLWWTGEPDVEVRLPEDGRREAAE